MIEMKDSKKTRLQPAAVTSYYADKHVYTMQNRLVPSIQLTVGSCQLELIYDDETIRDTDLKTLDCYTISDLTGLTIKTA